MFGKYYYLFKRIKNWWLYFKVKTWKTYRPVMFVTSRNPIRFIVPTRGLYLVFKEVFIRDFYCFENIAKALSKAPVVIDIGANVGYFDMLLFSYFPQATVFAYEPVKSNYELFKKNISYNNELEKQIHLYNAAVTGKREEVIELFIQSEDANLVTASVYKDFDVNNSNSVKVNAVSLTQIVLDNNLESIDLIKIDCEGSEYTILYNTPWEVFQRIKALAIEVHDLDTENHNIKSLASFLENYQYNVKYHADHEASYSLYACQ
jgi:FkbM family methyltransferase